MPSQLLISVGLPVYNGAALLPQALDSILGQDYNNLEIIISDNASTDQTADICHAYTAKDSRIRYYRNQSNIGPRANFERVLKLATGSYFMWVAHDDVWASDYVSVLAACYDVNPNAVLAGAKTVYEPLDGAQIYERQKDRSALPPQLTGTKLETALRFLDENATSWIYGLFKTSVLRDEIPVLMKSRVWGGDVVFLLHLCLKYPVIGSDSVVIYKRYTKQKSAYEPRTARDQIVWKTWFAAALYRQIFASSLSMSEKRRLLKAATNYLRGKYFHNLRTEISLYRRGLFQLITRTGHSLNDDR